MQVKSGACTGWMLSPPRYLKTLRWTGQDNTSTMLFVLSDECTLFSSVAHQTESAWDLHWSRRGKWWWVQCWKCGGISWGLQGLLGCRIGQDQHWSQGIWCPKRSCWWGPGYPSQVCDGKGDDGLGKRAAEVSVWHYFCWQIGLEGNLSHCCLLCIRFAHSSFFST